MDYIRRSEIGQRGTKQIVAMTLRFLAVQLFAAITLPAFSTWHPARMKWKPPRVGVAFEEA